MSEWLVRRESDGVIVASAKDELCAVYAQGYLAAENGWQLVVEEWEDETVD